MTQLSQSRESVLSQFEESEESAGAGVRDVLNSCDLFRVRFPVGYSFLLEVGY